MPEFERDAYGVQDAYQEQLRHYGIKQGRMPDAKQAPRGAAILSGTRLTQGTGMPIPKRKPVPTSDFAPRGRSPRPVTPPPRTQSPRTPRTPRTQSPIPEPQPSRTQSPARTIKRSPDGRFDPSSIQGGPKQPQRQAPASPSRPATPSSPSPSMKNGRTRTDSSSSVKSHSSRRGSFSRGLRRLSDAFKSHTKIVTMDRSDRMQYVRNRDEWEQRSRDNSPARQPHPSSPSPYVASPRVASPRVDSPNRTPIAGKFHETFDAEPLYPPPPAPPPPSKALPGNLTKGEKFAMSVSKVADPLKPKRKGTQDSDMSFGMTDLAPPGAMEQCESCKKPTEEYLIHGLCKQCHELHQKVAKAKRDDYGQNYQDPGSMFVDHWQFPQGRSTWPDVPTADQKYMKLPARKKILRIRDTIYEDPGNPFAEDGSDVSPTTPNYPVSEKPLPPLPQAGRRRSKNLDPFDINPFEDGAFARATATPNNSVADAWAVASPTIRDPDSLRSHRRSKSIAIPLVTLNDESGEYVAPRTYWRRGSLPTSHMSNPVPPSHDAWRDTRFDDFYEGLVEDYSGLSSKI